jgi:putative heme-binding domain-containing protein
MIPGSRVFLLLLLLQSISPRGAEPERWTTSRIQGSPEPPLPFRVERAFPNITFKSPLDAGTIPGTRRMVIVEQYGKIWSIPENENASEPDLLIDLKQFDPEAAETYGITFHPKFAENRFVFVWMVQKGGGKPNREEGTRIIRFKMLDEIPPRLDVKSGEVIFTWLSGGHNGGNLRFGPDGMLYLSTGDAEVPDPPDPRKTGQDISDLLASVLRIDVDHRDAGKHYSIPRDNPFINTPGARPEVWAYGFRNPWRLSFDSRKGDLWVADVGWELWEMVHRVERGGNYGWSITEAGKQDVHPAAPRGPTPILPPVVANSHDEAASITGGEVYYGSKLPELNGAYIYGDWQFGTFWSLKTEGSRVVEHRELCRTSLMPAGFGIAPDGELIICDHGGGGLWRFARNPEAGKISKFPRKLSETGLFADTATQKPAAGVIPYEIQAHRWADHATSQRWLALPNGEKITAAEREQGMLGRGRWVFPTNAVLALTYFLANKKIETQITHFDGINWGAYSYRWNADGSDAALVGAKGEEITVQGPEGPQPWKFFARSECLRCHTIWNNFTPGFNGPQLAEAFVESLGLKDKAPTLTDPHGDGSLELRARSYLHANCSVCHRNAGGGAVRVFLNIENALKDSRMLEKPVAGDLGLFDASVVAPGAPERSVLLYRMTTAGRGHMPYLGGKLNDDRGILLLRDWIASLDSKPKAKPNLDTAHGALLTALSVIDGSLQGEARKQAIEKGSALPDPLRRDLFERFLPPDKRRKVLGPNFSVETLLALKGDATRGKELFAAICAACHRAENIGVEFGPDLSQIGKKYDRAKLVEQIREPARLIEPDWFPATVKIGDGDSITGFLVGNTLKMAGGTKRDLSAEELKSIQKSRATLMPEGLLENLSAEEAADLLEFVASRK